MAALDLPGSYFCLVTQACIFALQLLKLQIHLSDSFLPLIVIFYLFSLAGLCPFS